MCEECVGVGEGVYGCGGEGRQPLSQTSPEL